MLKDELEFKGSKARNTRAVEAEKETVKQKHKQQIKTLKKNLKQQDKKLQRLIKQSKQGMRK